MKIRNLDKKGDWIFGGGKQSYSDGVRALKVDIQTRLLSWLGDCYFALNDGIDWESYLGHKNITEVLLNDLRQIILQTEGVQTINNLNITTNRNRTYTIAININSTYGKQDI